MAGGAVRDAFADPSAFAASARQTLTAESWRAVIGLPRVEVP